METLLINETNHPSIQDVYKRDSTIYYKYQSTQ